MAARQIAALTLYLIMHAFQTFSTNERFGVQELSLDDAEKVTGGVLFLAAPAVGKIISYAAGAAFGAALVAGSYALIKAIAE